MKMVTCGSCVFFFEVQGAWSLIGMHVVPEMLHITDNGLHDRLFLQGGLIMQGQ